MRQLLESLEQFAVDVILERRSGKRAYILRAILRALSCVYRAIVQFRVWLFENAYLRSHTPGCPVISVGNLTVGGTGKTPVVELLARKLAMGGRRVAILSRGYKSVPRPLYKRIIDKLVKNKELFAPRLVSDGKTLLLDSKTAGDEPFMLANNLRDVIVLVDRDRAKSSSYATEKFGVDVIILDDGLQYLRLKRKFNVVLVDSQSPFGNGFLLPRGMLREPQSHLRRATHILITKCERAGNFELIEEIRRWNPTAPIIECAHRPREARNILTGERLSLESLRGLRAGAISGIAVPESFESALRKLGVDLVVTEAYADHHRFAREEVELFVQKCHRKNLDAVLTTEKDAVRFPRILDPLVPIYCLRVEIEILSGEEEWQKLLNLFLNLRNPVEPEESLLIYDRYVQSH